MKKEITGLQIATAVVAAFFVIIGSLYPSEMGGLLQRAWDYLTTKFGWIYLYTVLGFVIFCLVLAFSRFGSIKLGHADEKPEYSMFSWFAMLFSAGMGIGLVFWSVAEPLSHFSSPPFGSPFSRDAALVSMRYTYFHWGIHPWAVYSLVGLALAYFTFKKDTPMLISSTFRPVLGDRVNGWIGNTLDGLAVLATVFGVATSLGLGTMQINSGLTYLLGIPNTFWTNLIIIAVITGLFCLSAVSGIGRGIKILSDVNVILAILAMTLMFFLGPSRYILSLAINSIGQYIGNFLSMSLATEPVRQTGWVNSWTVFYWAWWIAWAPFVGMFIARISRGRTIREFILGVMIAPVIFSFIWMGAFGGSAIDLVRSGGQQVASAVLKDIAAGLFVVLEHYPLAGLMSGLSLLLIGTFFVTSADSATFVVGMLLSRGSLEPTAGTKVFWGVMQGGIAVVLLITGGLAALQTASIVAAFPFMFVMLFMAYSLVKALRQEFQQKQN